MTQDHQTCIGNTLKIIGGKWTIQILHELCGGTKRFGQIQKALNGISPRTLSMRLDQLEHEKIISKKVFAEIPLHVDYTLTPKGQSLKKIIRQIHSWGQDSS